MGRIIRFWATVAVSALISIVAKAETVYLDKAPPSKVSTAEATKHLGTGKTAWKCERVKSGPNINPVKVPGSEASWHIADTLGTPIENPFARLAAEELTYRCKTMMADMSSGRVRVAR